MKIENSFTKLIGNTPLIKLENASKITKCNILGKAEFLNPGQSVKDRAALYIIKDAIKKKKLKKNGIIVEGTAGNTGIGLALVGNSFGFDSVIVMPKTQSEEKKNELRTYGAELTLVPAVPYSNPKIFKLIMKQQDLKYGVTQKARLMVLFVPLEQVEQLLGPVLF